MKMKFFLALTLAILTFTASSNAKSINIEDQRFFNQIGSWINQNVVKPINDHVINPVIGAVNTVADIANLTGLLII